MTTICVGNLHESTAEPFNNTLAYSENLIGSTPFAAPILWLTGNPILALNVVALSSVVLCGLGAYVLGRRVGLPVAAALVCGLVFAFAPTRFFRIGHTPGRIEARAEPRNPNFPFTLDLRR